MKKTNERGITLVALVVTIVVLLILAGITITYVLSEDGIIGQAQKASKDTGADHVNSSAALALAATTVEWYDPTGTEMTTKDAENLKTYFNARLAEYNVTPKADDTSFTFTVDSTKGTFTISASGTYKYNEKDYTVSYDSTTGKFSAALPTATPGA